MKKTKLLIPALSIASVGAIVAPIATSCAGKGTISFEVIKNKQWNSEYAPMAATTSTKYDTALEYQNACADAVNKNPAVWSDGFIRSYLDYVYWLQVTSNVAPTEGVTSRTLTVSNASIKNKVVPFDVTPIATSMVSFDLQIVDKFSEEGKSGQVPVSYISTTTYNVRNLPYTFYSYNDEVKPISASDPVTYDTTVAVPSMLYLFNDKSAQDGVDKEALLAFLESDFSIKFADKTTTASGEIISDFDITINDILTVILMFTGGVIASNMFSLIQTYFLPLLIPVQPTYLEKVTINPIL